LDEIAELRRLLLFSEKVGNNRSLSKKSAAEKRGKTDALFSLGRRRRGLLGHGRGVVRGDLPVVLVLGGDVVGVGVAGRDLGLLARLLVREGELVGARVHRGLAADEDRARQDGAGGLLGHELDEVVVLRLGGQPGSVGQRRQQHALLGVERDDLVRVLRLELVVPLGEEGGDLGLGGVGAALALLRGGRFFFFFEEVEEGGSRGERGKKEEEEELAPRTSLSTSHERESSTSSSSRASSQKKP